MMQGNSLSVQGGVDDGNDGSSEASHLLQTSSNRRVCRPRKRTDSAVDWLFVKRLVRLFVVMTHRTELLLLLGLIVMVCGNEVLVYFVGMLPSQLITGLINRDSDAFFNILWRAALFTISEAVILSIVSLLSGFLALRWREQLVTALHAKYLAELKFYTVNQFQTATVDNPDQRIVEDANLLCSALAGMFQTAAVPFLIAFYTWRVAAVMGWMGPVVIFAYFILGSLINKALMSRVAESVFQQERLEGTFRFGHARLRAASEQIALYRGGQHERGVLNIAFDEVLQNTSALLKRRFALDVSRNSFAYVGGFLSYVVVGLAMRFGGAFENMTPAQLASTLQQASFLSIMLISGFSSLVALTSSASNLAGYTARVAGLREAVASGPPRPEGGYRARTEELIRCENVCIATPDGLVLLENLNFSLSRGESVLVTGPSGSGKSSFVRVLHGLWPLRGGRMSTPAEQDVCFVPQEPYLVTGSLSDQITYPHVGAGVSAETPAPT